MKDTICAVLTSDWQWRQPVGPQRCWVSSSVSSVGCDKHSAFILVEAWMSGDEINVMMAVFGSCLFVGLFAL